MSVVCFGNFVDLYLSYVGLLPVDPMPCHMCRNIEKSMREFIRAVSFILHYGLLFTGTDDNHVFAFLMK